MGCCASTPAPSSPYEPARRPSATPQLPRDSSRAAINQSSRSLQPQPLPHDNRSEQRPNQRIRAPSPLARSPKNVSKFPPPWTRSHLEREREAFFETRVTGQPEVWEAMNAVCQYLRRNELVEAQGIMDALTLSCPNGRVAKGRGKDRAKGGVYDERGALYEIPEWVVTDPTDIIEDDESAEKGLGDMDEDEWEGKGPVMVEDGGDKEEARPKGKGRAEDIGDEIILRARLSDRGTDVEVSLGSKQPVRVAVQRVCEKAGCSRARLVYMGKPMDEAKTPEACGWQRGQVVNAFVFEGDETVIVKQSKPQKKAS